MKTWTKLKNWMLSPTRTMKQTKIEKLKLMFSLNFAESTIPVRHALKFQPTMPNQWQSEQHKEKHICCAWLPTAMQKQWRQASDLCRRQMAPAIIRSVYSRVSSWARRPTRGCILSSAPFMLYPGLSFSVFHADVFCSAVFPLVNVFVVGFIEPPRCSFNQAQPNSIN